MRDNRTMDAAHKLYGGRALCCEPLRAKRNFESPHSKRNFESVHSKPHFGVRELAPAFSAADSSAVCHSPRRVAASKSGDEPPHSKRNFGPPHSIKGSIRMTAGVRFSAASPFRRTPKSFLHGYKCGLVFWFLAFSLWPITPLLAQVSEPSSRKASDADEAGMRLLREKPVAHQSCSAFWNHSAAFIVSQHPQNTITNIRTAE